MKDACEYIDTCPLIQRNGLISLDGKHRVFMKYCSSRMASDSCYRKAFIKRFGKNPPDLLAPNGETY